MSLFKMENCDDRLTPSDIAMAETKRKNYEATVKKLDTYYFRRKYFIES